MSNPPRDFPWDDVVKKAEELITSGATVYQKFTCHGCGQRLTMPDANVFHVEGTCDKCNTVTNIKERGCNYMLVTGPAADIIAEMMGKKP
jgi:hypothetical protein